MWRYNHRPNMRSEASVSYSNLSSVEQLVVAFFPKYLNLVGDRLPQNGTDRKEFAQIATNFGLKVNRIIMLVKFTSAAPPIQYF